MKHDIKWLPKVVRLEEYLDSTGKIDFLRFINERKEDFLNDFFNPSSPVMFNGCPVYIEKETILNCDNLVDKNCYNDKFFSCENCPFDKQLDMINHIFTVEQNEKELKKKGVKIRLKKGINRKSKAKNKTPRTPGHFCIPRTLLSSWIKPIIMNANDTRNVRITYSKTGKDTIVLDLIYRKYKICLKEIVTKNGFKYYILKTAFYYTNPKELIYEENEKYIANAI